MIYALSCDQTSLLPFSPILLLDSGEEEELREVRWMKWQDKCIRDALARECNIGHLRVAVSGKPDKPDVFDESAVNMPERLS